MKFKNFFKSNVHYLRNSYTMQHEGFIYDNNNNIDATIIPTIGTNVCGMGANTIPSKMDKGYHPPDENRLDIDELNINIQTYRFQFTDAFNNELYKFAKIHQYDHRKVFKEAWEVWIEENANIVTNEVMRLTNMGYDGDIIDKMFKSARYYYRKKSTEKKALAERRDYVGVQKDLLAAMDNHIKKGLLSENYKPSDGFDGFCQENIDLLKDQVQMLCKTGLTNSEEIKQKIKKTYKNRYFLIVQQHS